MLVIFSVSTTATGGLCRHAAAFPLSYDKPSREHVRVSMSIPAKNEESVGIIFALDR